MDDAEYRQIDLKWKRIQSALTIVGFVFLIMQIRYNGQQLEHNARRSTWDFALNFDRMLIENPGLYRYFLAGHPVSPDHEDYSKAAAASIMVLDVFEASLALDGVLTKDQSDDWETWMIDVFTNSPILREVFWRRADWYSDELRAMATEGNVRASTSEDHSVMVDSVDGDASGVRPTKD